VCAGSALDVWARNDDAILVVICGDLGHIYNIVVARAVNIKLQTLPAGDRSG
jgi:hypothetical protein